MRGYLIRKLLLGGRKYSQNEGIAARKQANRVLLDRNDVQDLKYFLEASNCTFSTAVRGSAGSYTPSEVRQLFKAEPFQIGAFWAELSMDSKDAAYGAILGAFVGDAAGGVLEFLEPEEVTPENVDEALRMPGGGCWGLGPGQITDDSELAMCLLRGLLGAPASSLLPLDAIAHWFAEWLHSPPFDIGTTTQKALQLGRSAGQAVDLGARMVANAAKHNQRSLSNGCLMRVAPLAVWAHQQPADVIAQHAMAQTALTHPNKTAQVGTAAYCITIAHLITHTRDARGAIAAATAWLQAQQQGREAPQAAAAVLAWLAEAQAEGPGPEVYDNMGFMRWGFVHAFTALHLELQYVDAIRHVLLLGGDTDTNAAIVGGLMGAMWGASALPAFMTEPVLQFGPSSQGRERPSFLHPQQLPQLFEQLWQAART